MNGRYAVAHTLHFPGRLLRIDDPWERQRRLRSLHAMVKRMGAAVATGQADYGDAVGSTLRVASAIGLDCEAIVGRVSDAIDQAASSADLDAQRRIEAAALPMIERRAQSFEILAAARKANAESIPDAEVVAIVKEQISAALAADRRRDAARA